ncbi:2-dehydro-3-deoxygalactonokinase [Pararhizobium arenae]|uniref:2-dehydro-3-deoxygalactonokinase n=1 Tax=Pararhizobium arenae TaxID=1856850 RepID=UPI00094B086C|nr:2-dehydro-3-deoxygalactonokinase [Pararhizobium arenae]
MTAASYAAVDWGTTSFRLWLVGENGDVIGERRSGEGMTTAVKHGFSTILETHLAALAAPAHLPVIVCGMAGARQAWMEAGYLDTPAPLSGIVGAAVTVADANRDIRILPGLAQRSEQHPDVMRGEETQLLGAAGSLGNGNHLVCMPGTHSKWVRLTGGVVEGFSTYMTGELFDVISKHSILAQAMVDAGAFGGENKSFLDAVAHAARNPAMATNQLFTVRSGQLLHALSALDAKARLSGTLIGLEIAGALSSARAGSSVCLVASGPLAALYQSALSTLDLKPTIIDADDAVRRGLAAAARSLWPA